jgi:hypothetical protein
MSDNWGGFKNGQIPNTALYPVQATHYFKPDVGRALLAAIKECATHGINIHINEGYRPLGIPADQHIKSNGNGDPVTKTSTGGSNQWFQYGRMNRGETPTAAYPGGSIHGWGKAADVSPGRDNPTVKNIFAKHGFVFDIGSESWHAHYVGGSTPDPAPSSADEKTVQQGLKDHGLYTGAIDGNFGPASWKATQTFLKQHNLYAGTIDGVPGPITNKGLQTYAKNGGYTGAIDGILGPKSWAGFAAAIKKSVVPAAVVNPTQAHVEAAEAVAPVVSEAPVQDAPIIPPADAVGGLDNSIPTTPIKETTVSDITPAPAEEVAAENDALGILIPSPKNRKIAYAAYGLASLVVSNIAVGVMAAGAQAPVWLIVASAVIGNLAVPFSTIAIANASTKK